MADKFLNETGLGYYHSRVKTIFADKGEFDALKDTVDDIVAEGGEPNKIDTVKVNGVPLVPDAQKAVDVDVPTKTSELTNNGDGQSAFATQAYVAENGGKIDVIKVNGTAQTITQKAVDITVPTKTSDITNDSDFQNETEVQALIDASLADITGVDFQVVEQLPDTGVKGVIYLVPEGTVLEPPYDEYIWITPEGSSPHYEMLGNTNIDLTSYWRGDTGHQNSLIAITTAEIDTLFA